MGEGESPRTLRDEQIRVSQSVNSANDVLQSAQPYMKAALRAIATSESTKHQTIEVPPQLVRDLVVMLAAEVKRADQLAGRRRGGDPGDGDWNPFNRIDFEFD